MKTTPAAQQQRSIQGTRPAREPRQQSPRTSSESPSIGPCQRRYEPVRSARRSRPLATHSSTQNATTYATVTSHTRSESHTTARRNSDAFTSRPAQAGRASRRTAQPSQRGARTHRRRRQDHRSLEDRPLGDLEDAPQPGQPHENHEEAPSREHLCRRELTEVERARGHRVPVGC